MEKSPCKRPPNVPESTPFKQVGFIFMRLLKNMKYTLSAMSTVPKTASNSPPDTEAEKYTAMGIHTSDEAIIGKAVLNEIFFRWRTQLYVVVTMEKRAQTVAAELVGIRCGKNIIANMPSPNPLTR